MRMFPVFVEMGGPDVVYCTLPKPLGLWASTKVGFIVTIYSFIVHKLVTRCGKITNNRLPSVGSYLCSLIPELPKIQRPRLNLMSCVADLVIVKSS